MLVGPINNAKQCTISKKIWNAWIVYRWKSQTLQIKKKKIETCEQYMSEKVKFYGLKKINK